MKKFDALERMKPMERRAFLKALGLALGSPMIPADIRFACNEIVFGANHAYAQALGTPKYYIEIGLRDQFDLLHAFVPPGLAQAMAQGRVPRGSANDRDVPFYDDPASTIRTAGNNFYIARDAYEIIPHLDNVAVVELCEILHYDGITHGHTAGNPTRSPGCNHSPGPGKRIMIDNERDPISQENGNEDLYSSTPTPATLHNYYQMQNNPGLRTGLVLKGSVPFNTIYHFSANLPGADLERIPTANDLIRKFDGSLSTPSTLTVHRNLISQLIGMVDTSFLSKLNLGSTGRESHRMQLTNLPNNLNGVATPISLALSPAEVAYWSPGVSDFQVNKWAFWEQAAFAFKIIENDLRRSIALEFACGDYHDPRSERKQRAYATQVALPLARLIESLKRIGKFNETVISIHTVDGGRSPYAQSDGATGKNAVILAGGAIRGGYYGNIEWNGEPVYRAPDGAGNPGQGTTGNDRRVPGASIWKTAMKAAGIPSGLYNSFPDVAPHPELNYLLR